MASTLIVQEVGSLSVLGRCGWAEFETPCVYHL